MRDRVRRACTTATPDCTEWINLGVGPSRSLLYRTHSLDAKSDRIVRALVVIHGQGRNANDYFRTAVASAFLAGSLDDTIILAPASLRMTAAPAAMRLRRKRSTGGARPTVGAPARRLSTTRG